MTTIEITAKLWEMAERAEKGSWPIGGRRSSQAVVNGHGVQVSLDNQTDAPVVWILKTNHGDLTIEEASALLHK